MKKAVLRNPMYADIERYLRNAERGHLPVTHDGPDVTREITAEQVQKLLACKDCQVKLPLKPHAFLQIKKQRIGVCAKHWESLADTVTGWSGE